MYVYVGISRPGKFKPENGLYLLLKGKIWHRTEKALTTVIHKIQIQINYKDGCISDN